MISAVGPQHGRRGRSPIAYVVRDSAGFVVGLDLGGTNIRAGAADVFGEMIYDDLEPTTKAGGRALAAQSPLSRSAPSSEGGATHDRLLAIAISTPGVVDRETGRVRLAYNLSAGRHLGSARARSARASGSPSSSTTTSTSPRWARSPSGWPGASRRWSSSASAPAWGWGSSCTTSSCAAPTGRRARSPTCRSSATPSTPGTSCTVAWRTRSGRRACSPASPPGAGPVR